MGRAKGAKNKEHDDPTPLSEEERIVVIADILVDIIASEIQTAGEGELCKTD